MAPLYRARSGRSTDPLPKTAINTGLGTLGDSALGHNKPLSKLGKPGLELAAKGSAGHSVGHIRQKLSRHMSSKLLIFKGNVIRPKK